MNRLLPAALALVLFAAPVSAQTSKALDVVPEDALGFILVKDLRQLSDRTDALAKKLKVEERVTLLELIQNDLGIKDGLNDKGSALFIVMKGQKEKAGPDGNLRWVSAFPVTDHEKVFQQLGVKSAKDGINEGQMPTESKLLVGIGIKGSGKGKNKLPVLVAKKGDFVLVTPPGNRAALEHILKSTKSIAASLKPARAWLDQQDVFGVCTDHGVKVGLAMIVGGFPSTTPGQLSRIKETFAEVEKNLTLIAFGARIEKERNWRLLTRAYFKPDSAYANLIAKADPLTGKLLPRLPDERYLAAAFAHISAQVNFEGLFRMLFEGAAVKKPNDLTQSASRLLQHVSELGLTIYTDRDPKNSKTKRSANVALLAQVDDAPAFVEQAVDVIKQTQQVAKESKGSKERLKFEQATIAGKPSRLISVVNEQENKAPEKDAKSSNAPYPGVILLTELDSKTVLACVLPSADAAEAIVKKFAAPAKSLATNAPLKMTSALLPQRPQVTAYVDLGSFALLGFMSAFGTPEVPPLGFALATFPQGIEAQFVVPYDMLKAVADAVRKNQEKKPKE
jgi:hypothetical protein